MESYHSIQSFSHVRSQSAWPPHWVAEAILATGRNQRGSKDPHCPTPKPSKIPRWCKRQFWLIGNGVTLSAPHRTNDYHLATGQCVPWAKDTAQLNFPRMLYIYHFSHLSSIYCSPNYQTFVKSLGGGPTNRTALGLFWHWQTSSKIVARRFFLQFNLRYLQSAKLPWLHINPVLVMCQCLGLQLAYRKSCRVLLWMECQGAAVRLPKSSKTWILHDRDPTGAWSWPHWIVSESSYLAWATFWCAAADPGSKPESA